MAMARLALNNMSKRLPYSSTSSFPRLLLSSRGGAENNGSVLSGNSSLQKEGTIVPIRWENMVMKKRGFATGTTEEENTPSSSEGRDVSVSEGNKNSGLFRRRRRGGRSLWRNSDRRDLAPRDIFGVALPSGIEHALENVYRLFDNINRIPSRFMARVKEQDDAYKVKYNMPGLTKEDVTITVDDGVLTIRGENKEEREEDTSTDEEDNGDEHWSSRSYRYYNTSLVLPDDAKVDEIKAKLDHGVLVVTIPRTETPKKDVKQIQIE